jgi:hypothetical protein
MMELGWWWILALLGIGLVGALLTWRPLTHWLREVHLARAREMFALQREHLEAKFIELAQKNGKPRGLRWRDCDWSNEVQFARDKATGQMNALVGVTVSFAAIEGSDMEDWPEVAPLRNATGVFFFSRGQWHTSGRAIFNMNPAEALRHFGNEYEPVPSH